MINNVEMICQVCYTDPDGQDLSDDVKTAELASSESGGRDQENNGFGNNLAVPRHNDIIHEKCKRIRCYLRKENLLL